MHAALVYCVLLWYWTCMLWSIDTCQNKVLSAILNSQAGYQCTLVPRLPFPVPRSPFSVLRSPFSVPRSPFPVPRSPFPVSSLHLWLLWNTQWLYMFWCEVKSTSFIDDIPYKYLRLFVRIVICIVGKPSICNRFWIEEKCIYNLYIRKQTEEKLTLQVCLSVSHVLCLLPSLPDITNRWSMTSIGSQWVIDE